MKRLETLFRQKAKNILNIYFTAGYPHLDSTIEIMKALQEYGADIIELGMPYSDPLADGPVIQESSAIALKNGMRITKLLDQLKDFREEIKIPVVLMGYLNPVLQFGFEKFCAELAALGIDGLIIPDLPEHEFENEYGAVIRKYGLDFIFLVTPETSEERTRKLDSLSSGFLYAVSSSSTTGTNRPAWDLQDYMRKLGSLDLQNPVLVGFGIHDKSTFEAACKQSAGAIIGTAFIKSLKDSPDVNDSTKSFLLSILKGSRF